MATTIQEDTEAIVLDLQAAKTLVDAAGDRTILVISEFLDDSTRYLLGVRYVVGAGAAERFVSNRWAIDEG